MARMLRRASGPARAVSERRRTWMHRALFLRRRRRPPMWMACRRERNRRRSKVEPPRAMRQRGTVRRNACGPLSEVLPRSRDATSAASKSLRNTGEGVRLLLHTIVLADSAAEYGVGKADRNVRPTKKSEGGEEYRSHRLRTC